MKSRNKLLIRWVFYLLGLLILALGIMLNTKANLGVSPIISVPYSISHIIGFNFCKNCFDVFNVCTTFLIGLLSGHILLGLGIGTILSMIGVGRVIAVFNKMFKKRMEAAAFDYVEE